MDADLVPLGDHLALLVGMEQGGDRRHVERRRHVVLLQHLQDARHADAVAVLAPGHAADRLAALAQLVGLVVASRTRSRRRSARRSSRSSGAALRPARTWLTSLRQCSSGHCHGSSGFCSFIDGFPDLPAKAIRPELSVIGSIIEVPSRCSHSKAKRRPHVGDRPQRRAPHSPFC